MQTWRSSHIRPLHTRRVQPDFHHLSSLQVKAKSKSQHWNASTLSPLSPFSPVFLIISLQKLTFSKNFILASFLFSVYLAPYWGEVRHRLNLKGLYSSNIPQRNLFYLGHHLPAWTTSTGLEFCVVSRARWRNSLLIARLLWGSYREKKRCSFESRLCLQLPLVVRISILKRITIVKTTVSLFARTQIWLFSGRCIIPQCLTSDKIGPDIGLGEPTLQVLRLTMSMHFPPAHVISQMTSSSKTGSYLGLQISSLPIIRWLDLVNYDVNKIYCCIPWSQWLNSAQFRGSIQPLWHRLHGRKRSRVKDPYLIWLMVRNSPPESMFIARHLDTFENRSPANLQGVSRAPEGCYVFLLIQPS